MASPKRVPNSTPSATRSKLAERVAFDPFLPQEDLLNELIRNMINPDSDLGQNYYVGVITNVVKKDDPQIEIRDIFYSLSDNSERITKDLSDKKYNSKRVSLFVHIPTFITSDKVEANLLNYNNFLKIRVDYNTEGKVEPKPGNIVKIQFQNKASFYNPYVMEIEDVGIEYNDVVSQKQSAKDLYDQFLNCKVLNIKFPQSAEQITFEKTTKPVGGYVEAIKEIENVFTPGFISAFISTLKESEYGSLKEAIIELKTISVFESVYQKFNSRIQFKLPNVSLISYTEEIEKETYLILGSDVRFSLKQDINNVKFKDAFYEYLKREFQSRLGYTLTYQSNSKDTTFKLNLNLNFLFNATTQNVEDYIKVSEKTSPNTTYYTKVLPADTPPQTIQPNNTPDKCDAIIASPKGLYKFVYGIKEGDKEPNFDREHNSIDNDIIQSYYNDNVDPEFFLNTNYYKKLIGFDKNKDLTNLVSINNKFYTIGGETNDSYGGKKNDVNTIKMEDDYLPIITEFLKTLRLKISQNELLINNDIKNVLIIPRQVIKIKKGVINPKQDPNSRHFYGRAVDVAVYLKITENNRKSIVQVKPEIVLLYAEKAKGVRTLGHGLFLDQINTYYNHIEFLDGTYLFETESGPGRLLTTNDRFYTGGITDLEKEIDKSVNKLERLKEEIRNGIDYKNPITGQLDVRFEVLL